MAGHEVSVSRGALSGASKTDGGTTYYEWNFVVTVDGEVGIWTVWADTDKSADEPTLRDNARTELLADPGAFFGQSLNPDTSGEATGIAGGDTSSDPNATTESETATEGTTLAVGDGSGTDDPAASSVADNSAGSSDSGTADTGSGDSGSTDTGTGTGDTGNTDIGTTDTTGTGIPGGGTVGTDNPEGSDEGPSRGSGSTHGKHSSSDGAGRHAAPSGSGLQGSTGDQEYAGGGYGWSNLGAPRSASGPGAAPSTGTLAGLSRTQLVGALVVLVIATLVIGALRGLRGSSGYQASAAS